MKKQQRIKTTQMPTPPRWARALLRWYCRPSLLEDLEGDLNEYFDRNVRTKGLRRARRIYAVDVLKFCRLYTIRKPKFVHLLISWLMIGSYFKTTQRSLVRHKLFSFINIFGLAASMTVGMVVIAILTDLHSYDEFHKHGDRIYRLISHRHQKGKPTMDFATSTLHAGKEVAATVPGVEAVTQVRADFFAEVAVGDVFTTVNGLWADQNFLKIFSFPMLEGDVRTALKNPYSIVLTEDAAVKLFGKISALGKTVRVGMQDYAVTGVVATPPKFSTLRFEALGSFSTLEGQSGPHEVIAWDKVAESRIWTYLLLDERATVADVQHRVDKLSKSQNGPLKDDYLTLSLQPLMDIPSRHDLRGELPVVVPGVVLWILVGLAFVVVASACFNYTNLSIARALRRSREVGIRKIVGAHKRQVLMQFLLEAVVIALLALGFSLILFFFLRLQFFSLTPGIAHFVSLEFSFQLVLYFVVFATATGLVAGLAPALLFSRIHILQALKDASGIRLFRAVTMRKSLIVIQYVLSLMFITATVIGYRQYNSILAYGMGFDTENILNVRLNRNSNGQLFINELRTLPAVADASRSATVMQLNNAIFFGTVKYRADSSILVQQNFVDDRYVPLHGLELIAGRNLMAWRRDSIFDGEILVNEKFVRNVGIAKGDPVDAVGEDMMFDGRRVTIVGVLKDFHQQSPIRPIEPMVLLQSPFRQFQYVNVKVNTKDLVSTMAAIEAAWKKVDKVNPFEARFYDDEIAESYGMFTLLIKITGFLSFLAICIASLGLLGMVVFTTETKVKEVSIRKVVGASEGGLVILLSRGFLLLLFVAAGIALPLTYLFFDNMVLESFAYHKPIGWIDMLAGFAGVLAVACVMIGSQTWRVARTNPTTALKSE
jgi:putative ABC transport system permease protein